MAEGMFKRSFAAPSYSLYADITIGAAVTNYDITGLDFKRGDMLMLVAYIYDSAAGSAACYLYPNANYTATNYYSQRMEINNTSLNATRSNTSYVMDVPGTYRDLAIIHCGLTNLGYFYAISNNDRNVSTASKIFEKYAVGSTFTSTNLTSLRIGSSVASGIGIGSRIQLYKLNATRVFETILDAAATTINITGLNIDKRDNYMLVSDIYNSSIGQMDLRCYINGTTTATSYYQQYMSANGTSMYSDLTNTIMVSTINAGARCLTMTNINITQDGYFIAKSDNARKVGASDIHIDLWNANSNFTVSSITSIQLTSSYTNGLGIGTRFVLYKLN